MLRVVNGGGLPALAVRRLAVTLVAFGCSTPAQPSASEESSSGTTSGDATNPWSSSTNTPTSEANDAESASSIHEPDAGGFECDVWGQDCPPGEKCISWASDGGGAWSDVRCAPVAPDPQQVGEPCHVVDSATSGIDDCERGAMCFFVDEETLEGECVALCNGAPSNPVCDDPCARCTFGSEGTLTLCLHSCDPLAQDCAPGQACYPIVDAFACAPDVSGRMGVAGDPCAFINVCDVGLACVDPDLVPGCAGKSCCSPFCSIDEPDNCDARLPGTVCTALFGVHQGPDACLASGTVGVCMVPR